MKRHWKNGLLVLALLAGVALAQDPWSREGTISTDLRSYAEFAFTRIIFKSGYQPLPGPGNTAWRDWPEADMHFIRGVRRLTAVDIEDQSRAIRLTDEQLFDRPWIYAVEVGYWYLNEQEAARMRDYLLRGGFLMVDDFHGTYEWASFVASMEKVFPDRPIVDIPEQDEAFHVHYDLDHRIQIPSRMYSYTGQTWEKGGFTPHWRGIYDDDGRLMVAINHNMDIGDAWEHADWPDYPENMTALAYRFGINYLIYAMTH